MSKLITASILFASLSAFSPSLAFARHGEGVTNQPVQRLEAIPGASSQMLQGRAAERATLQPTFRLTDPEIEYAASGSVPSKPASGS